MESRVIIAIVARKYDFFKTGLGESATDGQGLPILNEKGQYNVKSELYNVSLLFPSWINIIYLYKELRLTLYDSCFWLDSENDIQAGGWNKNEG